MDTLKHILTNKSFKCADAVVNALGFVPKFGVIFSGILYIQTIVDSRGYDRVNDARGYAKIINMHDCASEDSASYMYGWVDANDPTSKTPTTASISSGMESITTRAFPEHDPWEN